MRENFIFGHFSIYSDYAKIQSVTAVRQQIQLLLVYFTLGGCGGPERTEFWFLLEVRNLFGAGVLGDSLGSLRDGVFGQLTGQEEPDSGLDLSAGDGGTPVVVGEAGGLSSNALEDVVDKGVHDAHGLAGDSSVRVDLLEDLVDVDGVGFPPPPLLLLVPGTGGLCLAGGLLGSLGRCGFGWHSVCLQCLCDGLKVWGCTLADLLISEDCMQIRDLGTQVGQVDPVWGKYK